MTHPGQIEGPSQAATALHPQLPQLVPEMFDVRLASPLDTHFLNQTNDMVQLRSYVRWKGIELCADRMIQDLDVSSQRLTMPVLICATQCTTCNAALRAGPFEELGEADIHGSAQLTPSRIFGISRRIKPRYEYVQSSSLE